MGGGAFAQAAAHGELTLNTPRMSPEDYARIKSVWLQKLDKYFSNGNVGVLIPAPEKPDYGDMDVFVTLSQHVDFIQMANQLGAAGIICPSGARVQKCALAVPKDGTTTNKPLVVYKHVDTENARKMQPSTTLTTEEYAQIDIEVVPPELEVWHAFYSSYGDLANLLGAIVTNLGFKVSDRGFWLRLRELDLAKDIASACVAERDGVVYLSDDPNQVMRFLGLSVERYDAGFETLDAMYEWLGACRVLSAEVIRVKRNAAHERDKEGKRAVLAKFFQEWLPAHMDMQVSENEEQRKRTLKDLRDKCCQEATEFFDKRAEYNRKHDALVLALDNAVAVDLLKPLIVEHSGRKDKSLVEIVRAFRRWAAFDANSRPFVLETSHSDAESQLHRFLAQDKTSLNDPDVVNAWVGQHWDELRAMERQKAKDLASARA